MELFELLKLLRRSSIKLSIQGEVPSGQGSSHFGGVPDVPQGFNWPYYETDTYDDTEVKLRPLAFLAQINCATLPKIDEEDLLPQTGILSFFYELGSMKWGYDPNDKGCVRVFWFEDTTELSPAVFPKDLAEDYRLPAINIEMSESEDYPEYQDFSASDVDWEIYDAALEELGVQPPENCSKLLGWPNIIQDSMTVECEMASRGYYMGDGWDDLPKDVLELAKRHSGQDWVLLLQLDTVEDEAFELMFGDCGRIYVYIRKEDLKQRHFDRVWLILQCG